MPMTDLETRALLLAIERHHGQERKLSKLPYVTHPIRVAKLAGDAADRQGLSPEDRERAVLAGLLHDTVEDTGTTREEIAEGFSEAVAELVMALTQDKALPKLERRKLMIDHAAQMPPLARLVKLCDRLDNMRDLSPTFGRDFLERYCQEARGLCTNLAGTAPELEARILAITARHEAWLASTPAD
ncbi:MAG: HD domain-containing protein [Planctomycetota bacterium]|jgi:guanosine-3',5'-bis(diphosphate) 3'-pyrophosphohydrolase